MVDLCINACIIVMVDSTVCYLLKVCVPLVLSTGGGRKRQHRRFHDYESPLGAWVRYEAPEVSEEEALGNQRWFHV